MQAAAANLIADDAHNSRGLQEERELIQDARAVDAALEDRAEAQEDPPSPPPDGLQSRPNLKEFQWSTRSFSVAPLELYQTDSTHERKRKKREWYRRAMVNLIFIALWYLFSTLLSVYNKWMFSPQHYDFAFPLFVTTFHMLVQFILSGLVLSFVPKFRPKVQPNIKEYTTKAGPCGVATSLDIGLSNLALKTVTLSFYTMCKSSTLGFVLLFAFLFKLERPTWRLVGIISIITVGLVLMVSGETQFSFIGMMEVLTASAMGGLRWALTQKLLDKEAMGLNNPFATLFWLTPIMAVTLAICSLAIEGPWRVFAQDKFWGTIGSTLKTAVLITAPGGLAFAMTTSEFALIQRTSVVTLSVAGIFKEVSTIFVSTTIFHDELTPINISGLCITIFGIALYNYLKFRESTTVKPASPISTKHGEFQNIPNGHGYGQVGGSGSHTPYGDASHAKSQVELGHLPVYNPADESAVLLHGRGEEEIQHTIFGDSDSESDSEDQDSSNTHLRKDPQDVGREIEGFSEQLHNDQDLKRLQEEENLLERSMELPPQR